MSKVLVIIVNALKFLLNEAMSALKWGEAFAIVSATFFEVLSTAIDKTTSKKGEISSRPLMRPNEL